MAVATDMDAGVLLRFARIPAPVLPLAVAGSSPRNRVPQTTGTLEADTLT